MSGETGRTVGVDAVEAGAKEIDRLLKPRKHSRHVVGVVSAQFKLIGRVKRRESEARLLGVAANDLEPGEALGGALEGRERKLGIERGVDERKPEVGRARIDAARWRAHSDRLQEGDWFGERRRVAVAAAAETRESAGESERQERRSSRLGAASCSGSTPLFPLDWSTAD